MLVGLMCFYILILDHKRKVVNFLSPLSKISAKGVFPLHFLFIFFSLFKNSMEDKLELSLLSKIWSPSTHIQLCLIWSYLFLAARSTYGYQRFLKPPNSFMVENSSKCKDSKSKSYRFNLGKDLEAQSLGFKISHLSLLKTLLWISWVFLSFKNKGKENICKTIS